MKQLLLMRLLLVPLLALAIAAAVWVLIAALTGRPHDSTDYASALLSQA
jgi:hypothetical protein